MNPEDQPGQVDQPAPAVPPVDPSAFIWPARDREAERELLKRPFLPDLKSIGDLDDIITPLPQLKQQYRAANTQLQYGTISSPTTGLMITDRELDELFVLNFSPGVRDGVVVWLKLPAHPSAKQHLALTHLVTQPPQWLAAAVVQDIAVHLAIKRDPSEQKKETMLAKILRLYKASMTGDVRSPLVHIVGPPGCGKSTSVEQAAKLLGVKLHIINVSRMSPLDIEGVQMPDLENIKLRLLTATWWTDLEDGDIVLFDEFLRGFPEVYNGLLDILTSRRVGSFHLPKVFFIAASNSVATYDKALEDRLLHLMVEDPRKNKGEKQHMAKLLVNGIGLHPDMEKNYAMEQLLETEVLPMFALLDAFKGKATVGGTKSFDGHSVRNLIGQARLRQVESTPLKELLEANNRHAESRSLWQYIVLPSGENPHPQFVKGATQLLAQKRDQLTEIQVQNLELNLELVELEAALKEEV